MGKTSRARANSTPDSQEHPATSENNIPEKRRQYCNLTDAYRITERAYPWIVRLFIGSVILTLYLALITAALTNGNWILRVILGVALGATVVVTVLSLLIRRAMYAQIDGTVGPIYATLSQIRPGWIISKEPVNVICEQDMIWRLTGRSGVTFISEGPSSHVQFLLFTEREKVSRVIKNVPTHAIQIDHDEGQIELTKLKGRLRELKKVLTKEGVPVVSARLKALRSHGLLVPKGVDPTKVRPNRHAVYGR